MRAYTYVPVRVALERVAHVHLTVTPPPPVRPTVSLRKRTSDVARLCHATRGYRVSLKSGRRHHLQTITSRRVTDRGRWPQPCAREAE